MPEFYYQIKAKNKDGYWGWPPVESDKIEASDSKAARKILEEEFGLKLPGRELKDDPTWPFMLTLTPLELNPYLKSRFVIKKCKVCEQEFTDNEKYKVNAGGSSMFCTSYCSDQYKLENAIGRDINFDYNGIHKPVIYKITNKTTGQCYIGKTTQAFTLRWYQHFFQSSSAKLYAAKTQYDLTHWCFEVIEIISIPADANGDAKNTIILERETYWIKYYDSIANGYNSVISLNTPEEKEEGKLFENIL